MNQQLFKDLNNTLTAKQHIEQWLKSGLTQSEYCRKWGINVSTFANWHQKYKRGQKFQSKALVEIKPQQIATALKSERRLQFRLNLLFLRIKYSRVIV